MPAHRKNFDSAVEMYNSGLSVRDVALAHGLSHQAMWSALKRRGVQFRPHLRYGEDNHFFKHGTPEDVRVHLIVTKAIKKGRLIPKPCEVCGAAGQQKDGRSAVQAHHDDYNKPLEVRWLCDPHHREWHKHNEPVRRTIDLPPMKHRDIARLGGSTSWARNQARGVKQLEAARAARKKKRSA